ncbi:MAG: hypothetical protein ACFFAQ_12705 [Promethearchaeota archaeon]
MTENHNFLCEVVFSDHNWGSLTSLIGHINENQLQQFSNGGDKFLTLKEKHHPPIYKPDIKEIIIYKVDKHSTIGKEKANLNYFTSNFKVKIS